MKFETCNKNLIIQLSGELDHHHIGALRDKVDMQLNQGGVQNIVFDFKNVHFMDSSGIGFLIGRYRQINGMGGRVLLTNVSKPLHKVFRLAGIYRIMDVHKDVDQALKAL